VGVSGGGDNMAAGRKRKPTVLKVLEGNPGKRPLNKNGPKPKPVAPKTPKHLNSVAKKEWKRVAAEPTEPVCLNK